MKTLNHTTPAREARAMRSTKWLLAFTLALLFGSSAAFAGYNPKVVATGAKSVASGQTQWGSGTRLAVTTGGTVVGDAKWIVGPNSAQEANYVIRRPTANGGETDVATGTVRTPEANFDQQTDFTWTATGPGEYRTYSKSTDNPDWVRGPNIVIPGVDADVDSDNNGAIEDADEPIEEDLTIAGKIIPVNDRDHDADGIPDYGDGWNRDPNDPQDDTIGADANGNLPHFTPLRVTISAGLDLASATLTFAYSESTLTSYRVDANGKHTPGPGHLRIWKKDAGEGRARADVLSNGSAYTANSLGFSDSQLTCTFYLEAIALTDTDAQREITVTLSTGSDSAACSASDKVVVSIIKMEFVIPAAVYYDQTATPQARVDSQPVATDFVGVSDPMPTVRLVKSGGYDNPADPAYAYSADDVTLDTGSQVARLRLHGYVADSIADNVPAGAGADIQSVTVYLDDGTAGDQGPVTRLPEDQSGAKGFWRQHPYRGEFDDISVAVPLVEGMHTVRVETSENAVGNKDYAEIGVTIEKRKVPGTGTGTGGAAGGDAYGTTAYLNIYLPQELSPARIDTIQYYRGERDPLSTDLVLTEEDAGKKNKPGTFRATLNGMPVEITLNGYTGLTTRVDDLNAQLVYVIEGVRVTHVLKFTETGPETRTFRTMFTDNDPATVEANLYLPINATGAVANKLQYYYGPRRPLPEDPVLAEAADNPASLIFQGTFANVETTIAVTKINGLAPVDGALTLDPLLADSLTATITYRFPDGARMTPIQMTFAETELDSRLFRATLPVGGDGGGGAGETTFWTTTVDVSPPNPQGTFIPATFRIKGLPAAVNLDDFSVDLNAGEQGVNLNRKPDGYVYLKGPSEAIGTVVERKTSNGTTELHFVGYIKKGETTQWFDVPIQEETKDKIAIGLKKSGIKIADKDVNVEWDQLDFYSNETCTTELDWPKIKLISDGGDGNLFIGYKVFRHGKQVTDFPTEKDIYAYRCTVEKSQLPGSRPPVKTIKVTKNQAQQGRFLLYVAQTNVSDFGFGENTFKDDNELEYAGMDGYHTRSGQEEPVDDPEEPDAYFFGEQMKKNFPNIKSRGIAHPIMDRGTEGEGQGGNGSERNGRPIANEDFFRSGGVEKVVITARSEAPNSEWRDPGMHADMDHVLVANPADIFYVSGHGLRTSTGYVFGEGWRVAPANEIAMASSEEMEWLVLSVCHQANLDEVIVPYVRNIAHKDETCACGQAWYKEYLVRRKAHGVLGFAADGWSNATHARRFADCMKNRSVYQAWKDTWFQGGRLFQDKAGGSWRPPAAFVRDGLQDERLESLQADPQGTSVRAWTAYENYSGAHTQEEHVYAAAPPLIPVDIEVEDVDGDKQHNIWEGGEHGGYVFNLDSTNPITVRWKRAPINPPDLRLVDDAATYLSFDIEVYGDQKKKPNMNNRVYARTYRPPAPVTLRAWVSTGLPANSLPKNRYLFIRMRGRSSGSEFTSWSPLYEIETD